MIETMLLWKFLEGKYIRTIDKYPSKLREKLSFLEGKVQRIASDIKRTKEILDSNNPDSSKLILYDIQNKISGIEKAVGQVINGSKGEFGLSEPCIVDNSEPKHIVKGQLVEVVGSKVSTKGLNHEELEARFFPHHRLLRNRTSLDTSGGQDMACKPIITKHSNTTNCEVKAEYMPPAGVSQNLWGDCWLIRAPGADSYSGRYVVAASASNTLELGFVRGIFIQKISMLLMLRMEHQLYHQCHHQGQCLPPYPTQIHIEEMLYAQIHVKDKQQWWYRPCGPLLLSTCEVVLMLMISVMGI